MTTFSFRILSVGLGLGRREEVETKDFYSKDCAAGSTTESGLPLPSNVLHYVLLPWKKQGGKKL